MAKFSILAGSTSQSVSVFIQNSSSTTGAGLTGLLYNASGLTAYYTFTGTNATSTVISLATLAAVNSAYSSGGFKEIDSTNMPGVYRLDLPNAVLASSKGQTVVVYLQGASNMAPCVLEIELTAVNNQSTGFGLVDVSSNVVQWNGTNVSSPATAGIPDVNIKNSNNVTATAFPTNFNLLSINGSGFVTFTSQEIFIKKNAALNNFEFLMTDSTTHNPKTGLGSSITCQVSKDGGSLGSLTNSNSEIGSGLYAINLASADTNFTVGTFVFSATGADSLYVTVVTQP